MAKFETGHKRSNTGAVVIHLWNVMVYTKGDVSVRDFTIEAPSHAKLSTIARRTEEYMSMTGHDMLNTYMQIEKGEKL